jgi:hypothetical protein
MTTQLKEKLKLSDIISLRIPPITWDITFIIIVFLNFKNLWVNRFNYLIVFCIYRVLNLIFDKTTTTDKYKNDNIKIKDMGWLFTLSIQDIERESNFDKIVPQHIKGDDSIFPNDNEKLIRKIINDETKYDKNNILIMKLSLLNDSICCDNFKYILLAIYLCGITHKNFTTLEEQKLYPDYKKNSDEKYKTKKPKSPFI